MPRTARQRLSHPRYRGATRLSPDRVRGHAHGSSLTHASPLDDRLHVIADPIVDLRSGVAVAAELVPLIACHDAAPSSVDADAWLVEQAVALAARGKRVHVSLCRRSVLSQAFAAQAERAVVNARVAPWTLTFEFDEEVATRDVRALVPFALAMGRLGVALFVNDVSLRYGSLDYLHRFDVAGVKIDAWLVASLLESPTAAGVVRHIIHGAHGVGASVIADGVADGDTLLGLRLAGADRAQGICLSGR